MNLALRKQELLPWTFFPSRDEKPLLIRYQVWRCQGVCYIIKDSNVLNCNLHCNSLEAEAKISAKVVDLGRPDRLIKLFYCSICSVKRSWRHKFQCFEGFHRYSSKEDCVPTSVPKFKQPIYLMVIPHGDLPGSQFLIHRTIYSSHTSFIHELYLPCFLRIGFWIAWSRLALFIFSTFV